MQSEGLRKVRLRFMSPHVIVLGKKSWKCGCITLRWVRVESGMQRVLLRGSSQDNIPVTFMYSMKSVKLNCKSIRHQLERGRALRGKARAGEDYTTCLPIAIDIGVLKHELDLLVRELLPAACDNVGEAFKGQKARLLGV